MWPKVTTRKTYYLYLLAVTLTSVSCQSENSTSEVFKIDSNKSERINLSEYFEIVSVEAIDEGRTDFITDIYKVRYFDSKVYLLDRFSDKKISVYNYVTGEFLHNVGYIGEGPGGFTYPYDLYIDEEAGILRVLTTGRILNYRLDNAQYIDQIRIDFPAVRFSKLNNGNWLFVLGRGSDYQTIITDDSYRTLRSHLPRLRMHNMLAWEPIVLTEDNRTLIVRNFDNKIYEINDENELDTIIRLEFGDRLIPEEEKKLISQPSSIATKYSNIALLRRNFYLSKDYCLFVYQKNGKYNVVVKNLSSNEYISFDGQDVNNDMLLVADNKFPLILGMDDEGNFITRVRSNITQSSDGSFTSDNSRNNEALTLIRFKPKF
jgi:hypothetical protein